MGISQMMESAKGIKDDNLMTVAQWYFSLENIQNANNLILKSIYELEITSLFVEDPSAPKTASDGQKLPVKAGNRALNASYSFKYFGSGRGVSSYTFNDERNSLFHNLILSSSERESMYLIDGLVKDEVVRSKWHTTDTEGFTEVVFAITNLMGIQFVPRIKAYKKQTLYTFKPRESYNETYREKGYKVLPEKYLIEENIVSQWDAVLKFASSIISREVTPSKLFKRLNSYSKQHPLYKALKEYGKIVKTMFILKYYDDVKLRQTIEYRLNMMELTQKFSKAVFFANNQEIEYDTVEEQSVATSCKQLIQNSIVLWNYMLLTQMLIDSKSKEEKQKLIDAIKRGTILTWRHVNFYGIYDFSNIDHNGAAGFDIEKIKNFKL